MDTSLLTLREGFELLGRSHSSGYIDISNGLFVPGFSVGKNAKRVLRSEVEAIRAARIAGKSEDEIRHLVQRMVADRKVLPQ